MKRRRFAKAAKTLKGIDWFDGFTPEELRELEGDIRWIEIPRGRVLHLSHDVPPSILILKKGRFKLFRISGKGRELILDFMAPGRVFGETSLAAPEPDGNLAEALEDSLVAVLPWPVLERWFERKPELLRHLSRLLVLRCKRLEERLADLAFKPLPVRLATLLLRLSREYGVRDSRGILLPIKLSQSTMGSFIAGSREMVNLTLSRLRRQGVIEQDSHRLVIRQRDVLERLNA